MIYLDIILDQDSNERLYKKVFLQNALKLKNIYFIYLFSKHIFI